MLNGGGGCGGVCRGLRTWCAMVVCFCCAGHRECYRVGDCRGRVCGVVDFCTAVQALAVATLALVLDFAVGDVNDVAIVHGCVVVVVVFVVVGVRW